MSVHPQIRPILEAMAPFTQADWGAIDAAAARSFSDTPMPPPYDVPLASVDQVTIDCRSGAREGRLYRPSLAAVLPAVVFFHGGGWVVGTLDTYDFLCRILARETGCAILSVAYRLAPEHPYPAAIDDCYDAVQWLAAADGRLGIDAARLAVAGDSAGGNLAAAVAVMTRDLGGAPLRHQALLYPVMYREFANLSYRDNDGYLLTRPMMEWYWRQYVGERCDGEVPFAAVGRLADLANLPAATVLTAEFDPLRDEGEQYARRLAEAGVPVNMLRSPRMIHGFASFVGIVDPSEDAVRWVAAMLRAALAV